MTEDLKDLLRNCLTALNNATEEDIAKMQATFDREVGRYKGVKPSIEFEPIYPNVAFTDEELVNLLGQEFMDSLTNLKWTFIQLLHIILL